MSRRFLKSQQNEQSSINNASHLPIDDQVAVYYRQSTDAQVGNISTDIQTIDMALYLQQQGWKQDDIVLIDMDEGVSGTKRIDERPGMRTLFDLIVERRIRAVACQDEDRLFRDVTQIQVNIFIQACKEARVLVITPSMVYDFAHEQLGVFHARQFRFKCEMAAEYINTVIIGKLHRAKQRLMREGRWAGANLPPGFMVDTRKTLPDGSPNPHWYKYVPFEPFAEVIRTYFRIFIEGGGSIATALRRIRKERIYYPDPTTCLPPEGFATNYRMRKRGDGYYPGRSGLWLILTNPAYIGHWCFQDEVIRRNNHPPIISQEQFMQAFNYLSKYDLDGSPNATYHPVNQNARPTLDSERPVERPLFSGLIYGYSNNRWKQVGTQYVLKRQCYMYLLVEHDLVECIPLWERTADWVDEALVRHFHEKLYATFNADVWKQNMAQFSESIEREKRHKRDQLAAHEEALQNMVTSLETLSEVSLIQAVEARYKATKNERDRLRAELETIETENRHYEMMQSLQATFAASVVEWPSMSRDDKHIVLQAFIARIEAVDVERYKGMRLIVYWRDGSKDELRLNKKPTVGQGWTQHNIDKLLVLVDAGASQADISAAFPEKRWKQIRQQIDRWRERVVFSPAYLRPHETYADFIARGGQSLRTTSYRWSEEDLAVIRNLIDDGATQLTLMKAFPFRRWRDIRSKLTAQWGSECVIALDEGVSPKETYQEYQKRSGDLNVGSDLSSPSGDEGSSVPHAASPLRAVPSLLRAVDRWAARRGR
ncbi:MAG: recombinase family protein [Chloroflexi bacterium]|uniref:recombinase family protein n=1 Tax=Candidatus Flexifilum breve TaxID=3140694 RepID=UPI0031374241|nr:recombinase family protein [Chloroflexota bacterium]